MMAPKYSPSVSFSLPLFSFYFIEQLALRDEQFYSDIFGLTSDGRERFLG